MQETEETLTGAEEIDAPSPVPSAAPDPSLYINRELSWLEFNARVLEEAWDDRHPLLERVKFLAIFGSNLDEFFMIRVSGLQEQRTAGVREAAPDGLTPTQALARIADRVNELLVDAHNCWETLKGLLRRERIEVLPYRDLRPEDREALSAFYQREVFLS